MAVSYSRTAIQNANIDYLNASQCRTNYLKNVYGVDPTGYNWKYALNDTSNTDDVFIMMHILPPHRTDNSSTDATQQHALDSPAAYHKSLPFASLSWNMYKIHRSNLPPEAFQSAELKEFGRDFNSNRYHVLYDERFIANTPNKEGYSEWAGLRSVSLGPAWEGARVPWSAQQCEEILQEKGVLAVFYCEG
ncbi:hypothetical protein GQ44DRAFT_705582 [Phaeosphaeriaceae sp. PMI808]|nr:hypothetical protein GQ44DRAFT_705582 [Phaeosphaeriaceae sp. PMI808]